MYKDIIQNKQKNKDIQAKKKKMYKDNIQNKQKHKDVQGQYPKQVEK